MTEADFLHAIREHPDDDVTRLAFADWLMERGDEASAARGELIQAQVRIARQTEGDPPADWAITDRLPDLRAREQALLDRYEGAWARPIVPFVENYQFRRGFVESITLDEQQFLQHADALFAFAPIRRVRFAAPLSPQLLASPLLRRVSELDLSGLLLHDGGLRDVLNCPHLVNLTWLDLGGCGLGPLGIALLAGSPLLARLKHLNLACNPLDLQAIQSLFHSPYWGSVSSLGLTGIPIDVRMEQFLTQSLQRSSDPAVLRSLLQLSSRQEREYTHAVVRDLARRASQSPRQTVAVLAAGLRDGHRKVRSAAAAMLARLGPVAAPALPALVQRLFDRNPLVREQVVPALARLLPSLPPPMQRWLCSLANPLLPPGRNLVSTLERNDLSESVLTAFGLVCACRKAWYAHITAGRTGPAPVPHDGPQGRPAVLTAVDELVALAARHAARHAAGAARAREQDGGRHREAGWLLARLTELLQAAD